VHTSGRGRSAGIRRGPEGHHRMTDPQRWLDANDQYLAEALGWVRTRLDLLAAPPKSREAPPAPVPPTAGPPPVPEKPRALWDRLAQGPKMPPPPSGLPPGGVVESEPGPTTSSEPTGSLSAPRVVDGDEHLPALVLLAHRLGLSSFEAHILLLCAAMEL